MPEHRRGFLTQRDGKRASQKSQILGWRTIVTLTMFLGGGAVGYFGAGFIKGDSINEMLPESGTSLAFAALNQQGVLPNQYPRKLLEEHTTEEVKDSLDLGFTHYQYQSHLSNNDIIKAEQQLEQVYKHIDIYPRTFQADILSEMLFFYTVINPNKDKTVLLSEELGTDSPKTSVFMKNLLSGTKAFLTGDKKLVSTEFNKVLASSKKDGTSLMYKDWIKKNKVIESY